MKSFSVAIIVVTYNGMQWLEKCLKSCGNYPVVVVDNASTDATVSFIESNYPNVVLLKKEQNLGFGQANNLGIRYALDQGAEHVFLLNQDAYLVEPVLDQLVAFQKTHPEYAVLSPVHITANRKKLDKNFSNFMLKEKTGQFYSDFVLNNALAPVYEVPFVNAAAWLVSKSCLEIVGGFDPLFYHYGEDSNYCQRVVFHGFKIGVLPGFYVIHDREERVTHKPDIFSVEYYVNKERNYKVSYANITIENKLKSKEKKLQNAILKLQMKMKFKKAMSYKRELVILSKIKPLIEKSREINKQKGAHYL